MKYQMKFTGLVKGAFVNLGLVSLARYLGSNGQSIPILAYHSVSQNADYCVDSIAVSPVEFEKQIAFLKNNYHIISLDEAVDCVSEGTDFPEGSVVITFDDGYLDNYTHALPILKKYDVTATFYVTAGPVIYGERFWVGCLQRNIMRAACLNALIEEFHISVAGLVVNSRSYRQHVINQVSIEINCSDHTGRESLINRVNKTLDVDPDSDPVENFMMSPDHIKEMATQGMTIGSHTMSHPILSSLPNEQAREELQRSRRTLEELLQLPVKHISYPNGPGVANYNQRTQQLASEAGYRSATTSVRGVATLNSNLFAMERQGISCELSHKAFIFKLEEQHFKILLRNTEA